jgi:hypothetical protein
MALPRAMIPETIFKKLENPYFLISNLLQHYSDKKNGVLA